MATDPLAIAVSDQVPGHAVPEVAQLVASAVVHCSVVLPPVVTDAGFAVNVTVGAGVVAFLPFTEAEDGVLSFAPPLAFDSFKSNVALLRSVV